MEEPETTSRATGQRWAVIGSTIAAGITIFAFATGYQSAPQLFGRTPAAHPGDAPQGSGATQPGESEGERPDDAGPNAEPSGDAEVPPNAEPSGDPEAPPNAEPSGDPEVPPTVDPGDSSVSATAVDRGDRPYDVEVAIVAVRSIAGETYVRLSLTNRGPQPLGYLYSSYHMSWHPNDRLVDRYLLRIDDGPARESAGQRGLFEQALGSGRHTCLALPAGGAAEFTVVFEGESQGDVATLQHAPVARILSFRRCEDTTIALPQFELRAPISRD